MIRHGCPSARQGWAAALVTAALSLAGATSALAATTVGQVRPAADTGSDCSANEGFIQQTVETGTPPYTVPADGVITSWSTNAGPASGQQLKLKVLRLASGTTYTVQGESVFETPTPSQVDSFPARIPVHAGDQLGLQTGLTGGTVQCRYDTASSADTTRDGPAGPGSTMAFPNGPTTQTRLNVAATVEPDADRDNFGDETQDLCWTDPSTQAACPTPTVAGNVEVGATLTATPNGAPMNPSYQWLRCDANGGACAPIPGANGTKYQVTTSDEDHTLRVRKSASNADGSQVNDSAPTTLLPEPAHLLGASVTRHRFRASRSPHLVAMAGRRAPVGTTINYTLDKAAVVRLDFTQAAPGRRQNGRCVGENRRNRHHRRCTRLAIRGSITVAGHGGQNSLRFFGWLSSQNKLRPAHYTLVINAITPGVGRTSQRLSLTVTR